MTTHLLRRRASHLLVLALATLTAVLLSLSLLATPASATEEGEEAVAEATGFGSGQWDGLLLAAGAGVLVGVMTFAMSSPGGIEKVGHGDH